MGEVPDYPTAEIGASSTTEEILAAIAAEEPHGATADQIARTLGLGVDAVPVQDELEELVMRGILDRRGIGLGAVYTLAARM
jgi:predicted ArsR family transcriptional regulator